MRPRDLEVLAFPLVLDALAAHAVSGPGAEACRALRPAEERADAERELDRQWSFFRLVESRGPLPLTAFPDVREALAIAEHEGALLPGQRLVEVRTVLGQIHVLQRFLRGLVNDYPALADLPPRLHAFPELEAVLHRMLDDEGELSDDASPHLAEVRAALRELRHNIEERLGRLIKSSGMTEGMADDYVTLRNNRFVLPVKAGAAARVPGVVQDRSASGETLFIEPLFAIELNNRLLLLRKEEETEETRLLGLMTAQLGAARPELSRALEALSEIDRLAAGATFARRLRCTRPVLGAGMIDLRQARHPELLLSGRAVVPIDVRITPGRRGLVVSGPNTGGKTVALKTLGLLTVCAHAGILIPAEEGSVVPFVVDVFTDVVDDQSIGRNLSTFSSHIANLVEIFSALTPHALVLLDEPGGGTDPEEGAALAVALIAQLIARGALVAAATHYAPVKLYALDEPRLEIATVDVDLVRFEPRFRLLYGSVGASLGLAMACRLGLPAPVLDAAQAQRRDPDRALARALEQLESSRRRFEDERAALVEERLALAEAERESVRLRAELQERRRARWQDDLEESRTFLRTLKQEGRELLEVIRRRPAGAAQALAEFVHRKGGEVAAHDATLTEHQPAIARPVQVGDAVAVAGTSMRGEVIALAGDTARVACGSVTLQLPLARVLPLAHDPQRSARPAADVAARLAGDALRAALSGAASTELHLIGLRAREAIARLERFLDQAQAAGTERVRIVHGLGTGALKRAVTEYLGASPYCTRFSAAGPEEGGAGVTIAELV